MGEWEGDYSGWQRRRRERQGKLTEVVVAARQVDGVLETDAGRQRGKDAEPEEDAHRHLGVAVHLDRFEKSDGPAFWGGARVSFLCVPRPE